MGKTKSRGIYRTVSLPDSDYSDIQSYVKKNDNYRSMAAYIIEATREKMIRDKQRFKFKPLLDPMVSQFIEIDKLQNEIMKRLHDEIKRKIIELKNVEESDLCSKCKKKQEEMLELIIDEYFIQAELGDKNAIVRLAMMMSKEGKFIKNGVK